MTFYIYKIVGINYIGSTNDIKNRVIEHCYNCYNEKSKRYNLLVYQYIREKEKDIKLEILGVYKRKCGFKIQRLIEQYYINKYDSVNNGLNTYNAFTNRKRYLKKYCEKNKEHKKKYNKQYFKKYYKDNKKKINKKKKMKINCPKCNSLISKQNLKRHQKTQKCKKCKKLSTLKISGELI